MRQRYKGPPHSQRPMIKTGCTGPGQTQAELVPDSYQRLLELTTRTTNSVIGASISTPTTVASAAPERKPKRLMAAATANSNKLDAPIKADGQAMLCFSPSTGLASRPGPS